ncbi:rho GTPase-activating protein 15 [Platysternon megacephalum]|uniref:Rho GTPase-activating protein 15 n=1 Tax=Platysternon megacephalum TaxID=55544 RepID=A0A4D9ERH6_9SAUR|nr:rho GTPase-activating protein 15 [Platysternon megacephalum]
MPPSRHFALGLTEAAVGVRLATLRGCLVLAPLLSFQGAEEEMERWEPPDQQTLPQPPRSSVVQAWQQITPSFETMLKQRAASRRKKKSEDKGYGRTRPRRSTAPSPSYPKQRFSQAPRRSKVLNNLYMNLYEEVGEDEPWAVQRVEGLPKACFVFSAIRNGRIHVNDLLPTLHTLGILVTSTEMRKVLKDIDIDANGNLSFTDFLEALDETSPFAQTEAFQNTYQAFSKMRKGLIAVDDLQPALISMGIGLSFETLQEALKHVYVNKDRQLNISDFLMAMSDLEHHYEDVESLGLYDTLKPRKPGREFDFDAKPRVRRRTRLSFDVKYLQKADAPQPDSSLARQQRPPRAGKQSSSPRPRFLSFQEKLPTRFDVEDGLEESPKTTKRRLTQQKPAWSTSIEEDLEESLEEVESPFGQERIQKSQRLTAARGPVGTEEPGMASAGGECVSDYEALQDAFEIVSKIKADNIEVGDLRCTLQTMGIPFTDEEFQEALQKVTLEKDGMVNFNRFMVALANTRRFSEFSVLKDAIAALSKMEGDKVAVSEALSYVKNMGIHLSDGEFQQALKLVSVDANGKVYIKDFIEVLTKSPRFSELLVLQDTIKAMSRIRGDLIDVQDLERTLTNMGVHLSKTEFREMLESVTVDKDGRVKLEQFMMLVSKMRRFSALGALNNAIQAFGQIKEDQVKISELESCLHHMGVHLTKEEIEEVTKSLSVSKDGTVDIKELMSALTGTRRFSNFVAVQEAIRAVKHVKEDEVEVSHLATNLSSLGLRLANEVIGQVLKSAHVNEAGRVKFTDFMRALSRSQHFITSPALQDAFSIISKLEDEKIGVQDLKSVLSNLDVSLSSDELSDVLQLCPVDDSGKVNLKDFIRGVTSTGRFAESVGLQLTCLAISKLKDEHFDLHDLESTLSSMGLHLAKETLKEVMKTASADDNGKVNFREFITVLTQLPHFPKVTGLKDAFDAMSSIKDDNIRVDALDSTLASMGIVLMEEELRELLASVPIAEDGTVNFKDVMMCMTGTRRFTEFEALQDAFNALSKISGDKIEVSNLPSALKAMGIHLTPKELQEALTSCPADESGRVNVKEFMKVLTNIPRFSEYVALQEALKTVSKIKEDKVPVSQLEQTLNSMGVHLTKESLQEGLKTATVDGDGKVNFKDFLTSLGDTQNFSELEALQNATNVVSGMHGGKIHLEDLKSTLENLGISLKEEELQETLKDVAVDERGTVNLKEFLTALASIPHFSDSAAVLQDAIGAFSRIKEDKVDLQDMDSILASLGISVSSEELQEALQKISPDEAGKVNFKEVLTNLINTQRFSETSAMQEALDVISKVEGDKIAVSHLESALANIGITLPKGELEEALRHATVDGDGKVNFKEFLKGLTSTKRFSRTLEMEGAVKTIGVIKEDTVDVHHLESIMRNMGIHLTPEEIQKALKHVTCEEDGKVNLKDFMTGLSKTRRFSQAEKDRVDVRNLDSILDNMGIYLTNEELQEALKHVMVDADGKVYLSKFLQGVRALRRFSHSEGKKVDIRDLDSLLAEMGMHLTQEELQEVLKHVIVDGDGKVNVSDFTKNMISTRRASQAERDRVATSHLDSILGNMGIFLTEEELQEALKHTEIDAEGKVNLSEFMKSVQRLSEAEGEKVDVDNLDSILANMGIHLTHEEFQKALGGVTRGADRKVELKHFMESVMSTRRPSQCERDTVDLQNLDSILDSMGVHLTNEALQAVLKHATVDANGKVNLGKFMKGVKTIQKLSPSEEDKVDMGNLDSVLANMGIHLTQEELQEALKHSPVDRDGTVGLSTFMKSVMNTRRPSQAERDKVDLQNLDDILGSMGVHLANEELQEALKHVTVDADGKVNLGEFMEAVRTVQKLPPGEEDKVDVGNLDSVLANMGIHLTQEELLKALKRCPVDTEGKVSLSAFMESMMSTRRPSQAQRDNVDIQNLDYILDSLGVHLTNEELQEVLKHVTVDADGKVNMGKFMKEVRKVQKLSLEGGE